MIQTNGNDESRQRADKLSEHLSGMGDFLYRVAYKVLRNSQDAEDAVQETYARLMAGAIDRYDSSRPFKFWARRVVRNIAIDMVRRNDVKQGRGLLRPKGGEIGKIISFASEKSNPVRQLVLEESVAELARKMAGLPCMYRKSLELYGQGFTYEEVAKLQQIPTGTVRSGINRARKFLRE